jgi:hypothetical protein
VFVAGNPTKGECPLSDTDTDIHPPLGKADRPNIKLPNGDTLKPRARRAAEQGICERTLSRMGCDTVLVANVAYISEKSFLRIVAAGLRAPKQRRGRRP